MDPDKFLPFSIELGKILDLENNLLLQMVLIHVLINSAIYFSSKSPFGESEEEFPLENTFRGSAQTVAEALKGGPCTDNTYSVLLGEFYEFWNNPYRVKTGFEIMSIDTVTTIQNHPWILKIIYNPE